MKPSLVGIALMLLPGVSIAQNQAPQRPPRVDALRRWSFGAQIGAGTMLHDFDHDGLSLATPSVTIAPRVGLRVVGPLSVQLVTQYNRFVRPLRDIVCMGMSLGVSVEPRVGRLGQLRVDGDFGVFFPGRVTRAGFDLGAAFEFNVANTLAVGPFVRFTHVWDGRDGFADALIGYTPQATQDTNSVHWWVAGVSFTLREPPKRPHEPVSSPNAEPQRPAGATP